MRIHPHTPSLTHIYEHIYNLKNTCAHTCIWRKQFSKGFITILCDNESADCSLQQRLHYASQENELLAH